ncbi:amidohydrolase [Pseudooceanicola spongiae]|uniref:Amidohydrolase family protein n=1 Tax=Pseudooceanicola spongiae TaxID=2613965 RepID=A0A7L9WM67_9RHOB|nr:amidohydrolase [Pseudooceanicola spongiae]QOL80817.1 amidohydrolase family protein [Pseudooceanicola spongiae]
MSTSPDLVILNGALITFDPTLPRASALAVRDGVIVAVSDCNTIRAMVGPATRVIDAQGSTVLPGFIDSHVHLFGGSVELEYLDLGGKTGFEAVTTAVRARSAADPNVRMIFAVQADYSLFGAGHRTTRHDLDRVLPERPFAIFASDHHTIWANTRALALAGLLGGGATEVGSEIVMGRDGLAEGELREPGAYARVLALTPYGGRDLAGLVSGKNPEPPATAAQRAADLGAIRRGLQHCASHGITGLHNMDGSFYTMELLAELEAEGDLICRTEVPFHLKSVDTFERFAEAEEMRRLWSSDRLWCNRVKMFMDGVVESHTALMLRPYPGSDHVGDAVFEPEPFNLACIEADRRGFQIATHAIGDLAVRRTLDGYQAARDANGARDARHRIEHIETLHPDDLPRFADMGIVASYQPGHAPFGHIYTAGAIEPHLHDDQKPLAYAWKTLRDAGNKVIFSTDWPVIKVDVMATLRAATAPVPMPAPWGDQRQTLLDALASCTADNAWVEFNEHRKGRLKAGFMADIVVMRDDLEGMEHDRFETTGAAFTISGGTVVFEA